MIAAAAVFALLLAVCLFVGLPHVRGWQRGAGVAAFVLLTGVVYAGTVDFLGSPKPMRLEWRGLDKATVISATMREGEAVYIWVQAPDGGAPRAYRLPWDPRMAQQVQDAMEKRTSKGTPVQMTESSGGGGRGTPKFYNEPQRPPPPKENVRGGPAQRLNHPDG